MGGTLYRALCTFACLTILLFSTLVADEFSFDEASSSLGEADPVRFELVAEEVSLQADHPFWIALTLDIDDHWHAYWKHPGDIGMPIRIDWNLPNGYSITEIEWPFPKKFEQNGFVGFGFENKVTLLAKITPPSSIPSNESTTIEADIRWLVCSEESCLPGEANVQLTLPVTTNAPKINPQLTTFFSEARQHLPHSEWKTEATANDGFIDLQVKVPTGSVLKSAYFCPAGKGMIDTKAESILSAVSDQPDTYRLLLKTNDNQQPEALKGVLVVEGETSQEALTVDLSFARDSSVIGMANGKYTLPIEKENLPHLSTESLEFEGGVGLAILFAFIGGAILNLMPCVLPVVSFKILSFVKMAGQSRSLILKHGLAFSAGVVVSFWVLAGLMLALQSYGQSVGWGFQLQEPLFVAGLGALLFLFGLSLFGVFEMGTSVTAWAGQADVRSRSSALAGSFFSGILATAVATPCTGPFLGSAIGFAVTLPTFWALAIFTSLGLGMASPYLLLAAFPSLLRFMPKPGNWMNTFKEVLGFVMLATVLWLVWVFAAQTNTLAIFMLLVAFFVLAIGAWIYGRWGSVASSKRSRIISMTLAAVCLGFAGYTIVLSTSSAVASIESSKVAAVDDEWEVFSPERVAELQAAGTPVLIDFTAKWCLICQANHMILSTDQVEKAFQAKGVVKMKADWTKNDPVITKALKKFGRNGVPLYVLYDGSETTQPTILPQVLTPDVIVDHVNKLDYPIASK